MAAPHVAGAAAVYLAANPASTPSQVAAALTGQATTGVVVSAGTGSPNRLLYVGDTAAAPAPAPTPAPTAPSAPGSVAATAGVGSATVAWTAPADGGSPITSYVVTAFQSGKRVKTVTVSGNATSVVVSSLRRGRTYTFTVAARNAIGTSPASAASSPVTVR